MIRFWLTPFGIAVFALGLFGCKGQDLQGAWRGPFPFEQAKDCRVRMTFDRRFDLACRQSREEWVGAGRWAQDGDRLSFRFEALARRGKALEELPPPLEFFLRGEGNRIRLERTDDRQEFVWERVRL